VKRKKRRKGSAKPRNKPWREAVDPSDPRFAPKGDPECLQNAIAILNPTASELHALESEIKVIAAGYNAHAAVAESAPRPSAINEELTALHREFALLSSKLRSLGDASRNQILGRGDILQMARIEKHWEPEIESWLNELYDGRYLERTKIITQYLEAVIEAFRDRHQRDGKVLDRGGQQNFFRKQYSHEKEALVRSCFDLFYTYRGRPTGTINGPFHLFISNIYDYAVGGLSRGDATGLIDHVKKVISSVRKIGALQ
jgi:hypothetical protein